MITLFKHKSFQLIGAGLIIILIALVCGTYLLSSNCSQVSLSILSKADTKYRDILLDASSIILPSHAFLYTTVRVAIKTGTIEKYIAKAFDDLCGGGER